MKDQDEEAGDQSDIADKKLVEQIKSGSDSAFEILYAKYRGLTKAMAMNVIGSEQDALDILQEVWAEFSRAPAKFDPEKGKFSSWIATMARNRSISEIRKRKYQQKALETESGACDTVPCQAQFRVTFYDEIMRHELAEFFEKHLALLPPNQSEVLRLLMIGFRQCEMAQNVGVSDETIRARLKLGIRKLRPKMEIFFAVSFHATQKN